MVKRRSPQTSVVHVEQLTDRMLASAASKVGPLVPPWLIGGALVPASWVANSMWGDAASLPWAAAGLTLSSVAITGTTALVTHARGTIGKVHSILSAAAATGWVTIATITGPVTPVDPIFSIGAWGGVTLAVTWNLRKMVRAGERDFSELPKIWEELSEKVGLLGSRMRLKKNTDTKAEGRLELVPGSQTPKDAQQARDHIASGLKVAPARVTITPHEERGDWAEVAVVKTDIMKRDLPWHGEPKHTGASIADAPLDGGLYADGEPAGYSPVNTHVQIMGMSGSAKSFGAGWNLVGDAITRRDAAVLAADATKGRQTLGPLEQGLHKCETTQEGAQRLLKATHRMIRPRTNHLSDRGLAAWEPGCGLSFLIVWLEEAPDMFDEADIEQMLKIGKAARSAGMHLMVSLQRATWDQIPVTLRGQLATKICLGVETADDAKYGLPSVALDAGAAPEEWADRKPGLSYMVAQGIDTKRYAMALRFWRWTTEQMRQHAAAFPAANRPLDQVTVNADPEYFAEWVSAPTPPTSPKPDSDQEPTEVIRVSSDQITQPQPSFHRASGNDDTDEGDESKKATVNYRYDDPEPDLQVRLNDPIEEETDPIAFGAPRPKMTPEQGQHALEAHLAEREAQGDVDFAPRDLYPLVELTGFQRTWLMNRIRKLVANGRLEHHPEDGTYRIIPRDPDSKLVPA